MLLILDWHAVIYNFNIWRLFTTFFFIGPFSMSFLFGMMMIYYSVNAIEEYFANRHADLGTMLVFNAIMAMAFATLSGDYAVMESPFMFSLIYVWAKYVPDRQMSIWGFPIMSINLPWVLMGFHLVTGGNPFNDLIGVAAGHSYIYLKEVLPESHGYDLIKTPNIMQTLVDKLNNTQNGGRFPAPGGANAPGARMNGLN